MTEPNPKIVKSRPRVPDSPVDGGVYDLPRSVSRDASAPSTPSAAKDIEPAMQEPRNPVDSYKANALKNPLA